METCISEADLSHLLSDLIENALIATRSASDKRILVHLGILYEVPTVEVSDSGLPFDPTVYQDFGIAKHSTHLNQGGSGIGLMDIWDLKKRYAASLHIYEFLPDAGNYTKRISLVFDHKKHYLIKTYRPQELVQMQTRSDLYILPL
jgi:sensor histidine kinase regulating citrate/malate metabolism